MFKSFFKILKDNKLLTLILVGGFLLTLAYALYFDIHPSTDAKAYDRIAVSLVQGTGYVETSSPVPDSAIGRLGPGYEFFLAFWYFIFGHRIWLIWIIQALLHTGSAFLLYRIIKQLYIGADRERWAILGAGFYIFFIDVLEFPAMLMTETLYLFLVILGLYCSIRLWKIVTLENVMWTSIIFTLALLVRPPAAVLLVFSLAFILIKRYYTYALVFVTVSLMLLAPWTIRNYIVYHRLIVTSAILGYDIWVGNSPDSRHIGELEATKEIDDYSTKQGLFAANDRGLKEVAKLFLEHPKEYTKLQLTKLSIYFSAARPAAFWFHLHGTAQVLTIIFSSLFAYLLFIFGLAGFWLILWRKDTISRMLILCTLAAPAGIIWIVAETRYRYQFYPMMIILGVLFISEFFKNKQKLYKILIVSFVLVTANTAFDAIQNIPRILERFHRLF